MEAPLFITWDEAEALEDTAKEKVEEYKRLHAKVSKMPKSEISVQNLWRKYQRWEAILTKVQAWKNGEN